MTDFSTKSTEELQEMADWFEEQGWDTNREDCIAELNSRSEPVNPEEDIVGKSESNLKEQLELFEEKGWEANAERVREELNRQEGMDSAEELGDSEDDDLTHAAHLSENDTMEIKVAKFYSSGDNYGDFEDMTEAERKAVAKNV